MKFDGGKEVSPKGNLVHSGAKLSDLKENTLYGSLKEDLPIIEDPQSRDTLSKDHQIIVILEGECVGTLVPYHESSKNGGKANRIQGDGTKRKAIGVSKQKISKSLGVRGAKAIKHHFPSTFHRPASPKNSRFGANRGSTLGTKFDASNGVGNLVQGQGGSS